MPQDPNHKPAPCSADVILAGGGLANCLIALRLAQTWSGLSVLIVEQGRTLGGNHTWSFHETDVTPEQLEWLSPLVVHSWPAQSVAFPQRRRTLGTGYRSITASRMDEVMRGTPVDILTGTAIGEIGLDHITLADGGRIEAPLVIDGRGYTPSPHLKLAWQKFLGQELRLAEPHGLTEPVIMDATVPQEDGYRFIYVLPFSEHELLIEDTYYADGEALDTAVLRERIADYAAGRGWKIERVLREEDGILPITLDGDVDAYWDNLGEVPPSGLRAGLFHPVTGYSLPSAVRLADLIAGQQWLASRRILPKIRAHAVAEWHGQRFYRLLNRMLFWAALPQERYRVLQRFYGLPEGLISRFYAGRNTIGDKVRLLSGKPPVPVMRALPCLAGRHPDGISQS